MYVSAVDGGYSKLLQDIVHSIDIGWAKIGVSKAWITFLVENQQIQKC